MNFHKKIERLFILHCRNAYPPNNQYSLRDLSTAKLKMSFKLGFYLLVESSVTKEELTQNLHKMRCFKVKDIDFKDGKGYRKASVSVEEWFPNTWAKEIQSNLSVGGCFKVLNNYGYSWLAHTQRVYENGEVKDDCGKYGPRKVQGREETTSMVVSEK